jgi:hypothetical protein
MTEHTCPCGKPATVVVCVRWGDGPARYRYCPDCAADVVTCVDGTDYENATRTTDD